MSYPPDKRVLLSVADGPESIEIYTSEDEGAVDWGLDAPALYLTATLQGAYVKIGPFCLRAIREGVEAGLKHE